MRQTKFLFIQLQPSVVLNKKCLSIKVTNSVQSHNLNLVRKALNMACFFTKIRQSPWWAKNKLFHMI